MGLAQPVSSAGLLARQAGGQGTPSFQAVTPQQRCPSWDCPVLCASCGGSRRIPEEIHWRKEQKKARFSIKIIISDCIVQASTIYIHESLREHNAVTAI